MFTNIGKKIKGLAKFICFATIILAGIISIAGIVGSIIFSMVIPNYLADVFGIWIPSVISIPVSIIFFILVFIVVFFAAWISTWGLYAFGELVDKATSIDRRLAMGNATVNVSNLEGFINTPIPSPVPNFNEPAVNESAPESEVLESDDAQTQIVNTVEEVETPDTEEKAPESKPQYKCPTCGSGVSQGDAFCGNCGQKFNW